MPAIDEYVALEAWRGVVGAAHLKPMKTVGCPLWRVVAEDGRQWVLKRLMNVAPGCGPVDEFRVVSYLQSAGLPVAVPIVTDSGEIVHNAENLCANSGERRPIGEHAYALTPLLRNDPVLSESAELAHAIGAGIGRLDRILAGCPWQVTSFTDNPAIEILEECYERLPRALRAVTGPFSDRLRDAIVDLPTQRAHGDCNIGNVLVHGGSVTGFIDFDHLPISPRVRDLSYYLLSRLDAHVDHGNPDTMVAALPSYIRGFHETYPLTSRELMAIVPLMLTVAIGLADWSLHGVPDPAAYHRGLRTIGWFTERYDRLACTVTRYATSLGPRAGEKLPKDHIG